MLIGECVKPANLAMFILQCCWQRFRCTENKFDAKQGWEFLHQMQNSYSIIITGCHANVFLVSISIVQSFSTAPCLAVQRVTHNSLTLTTGSLLSHCFSFSENRWDRFGKNFISWDISFTISRASLSSCISLPASCKHKLREWAKQWTGSAAGFSPSILVARHSVFGHHHMLAPVVNNIG